LYDSPKNKRSALLNKNRNFTILLAGIISLCIGVGVARFAFTTLLPPMLEDFLSVQYAGWYASFNYMGYLSGALFTIFLKDINAKVRYFRLGLVLSVVTTLILATTTHEVLWFLSRVIAGFGSAMVLIIGGALVMVKLDFEEKTKAMGYHFSGIGFAIVVSELIVQAVLPYIHWSGAWFVLALFAFIFMWYPYFILSFDKNIQQQATSHKVSKAMFTPYVLLLIGGYFTAGVTFVVQATFLPDIINSIEGLQGVGSLSWLIVGVVGVPSAIVWMWLAHHFGSVNMIIVAFFLQIIGILIPTISQDIYFNLLSGALYGSTFIAHVALFITYGGKLAGKNPVIFMGAMTAAYGIGQVLAPLYSVYFFEKTSSYDISLYITAFIALVGMVLLLIAKKYKTMLSLQYEDSKNI
jgi:predicted MFS family arabinose efflux permease